MFLLNQLRMFLGYFLRTAQLFLFFLPTTDFLTYFSLKCSFCVF